MRALSLSGQQALWPSPLSHWDRLALASDFKFLALKVVLGFGLELFNIHCISTWIFLPFYVSTGNSFSFRLCTVSKLSDTPFIITAGDSTTRDKMTTMEPKIVVTS